MTGTLTAEQFQKIVKTRLRNPRKSIESPKIETLWNHGYLFMFMNEMFFRFIYHKDDTTEKLGPENPGLYASDV